MESMSDMSAEERIKYNRAHAVDPAEYLRETGIVRETDDERELAFDPSIADSVREHMAAVREEGVSESDIATLFSTDIGDVTELDRDYTAYKIILIIRKWPSEAALEFDIAVDRALRETGEWAERVPPRQKYRIVESLRAFQDRCFVCDGPLTQSEEPRTSCCGEQDVITVHCDSCGERFIEIALEQEQQTQMRIST